MVDYPSNMFCYAMVEKYRRMLVVDRLFWKYSFVGFPIIQSLFGEHALAYAVVYDQLGSFLSLAVVGNLILAHYGEDQNQANSQNINTEHDVFSGTSSRF